MTSFPKSSPLPRAMAAVLCAGSLLLVSVIFWLAPRTFVGWQLAIVWGVAAFGGFRLFRRGGWGFWITGWSLAFALQLFLVAGAALWYFDSEVFAPPLPTAYFLSSGWFLAAGLLSLAGLVWEIRLSPPRV